MSELTDLTVRLREVTELAREIADGLDKPIAPRLELCDYLQRELGLDGASWATRLKLDLVAEEVTRIVIAPYAQDANSLAWELEALVEDEDDTEGNATVIPMWSRALENKGAPVQ